MVEGELLPVIRSYLDRLKSQGVQVSGAILHGPAAEGIETGIREIDLIVLSPEFGKDRLEEGRMLLRAAWETDPRIVPTPVHPDRWARAEETPFLYWAKQSGREIPVE